MTPVHARVIALTLLTAPPLSVLAVVPLPCSSPCSSPQTRGFCNIKDASDKRCVQTSCTSVKHSQHAQIEIDDDSDDS